jgi:hypothetical protein
MMSAREAVAMRMSDWQPERLPEPPTVTITLGKYVTLHKKVGFACGAMEAIPNTWSIGDDLRIIIRECLERLEEPE